MSEHNVMRCLRIAGEIERDRSCEERRAAPQIARFWSELARNCWRANSEPPLTPMFPTPAK
jgi:hypothetical protein